MSDTAHVVVAGMVRCVLTDDADAKEVFDATWPERRRTCMFYRRDFASFLGVITAR